MSAALAPSFVHPEWIVPVLGLWLLLGAALLGAALEARRRRRRLLGRSAGPLLGGRDARLVLAAGAIALALLGPRLGTRGERISTSGADVVVLLDVSRSMDARDVPPSRLDRARQAADRLLTGLEAGDRAALAAFAGRGVVLSPLTHDHEALRQLLPALDSSLVRPAASRLEEGIRQALEAFDAGSDRPRVLLVLSDGEDPDQERDVALPELLRAGVRVVSVAFGTEAGTTIPSQGLELRDRRGSIVTTRRDAARLAALADATGGRALATDAFGGVAAEALRDAVRADAPPEADPGDDAADWAVRRVPAVRVAPFVALALLLLLGDAIPRGRTRRAAAAVVLGALALGAGQGPHEPQRLLGDGLSHAARGEWSEAERAFRAAAVAARSPELAAEAYYDAGVAALAVGRLEAARDAFLESLALDPSTDARFNLEWTLRALAAPPPPPPPGAAAPTGESPPEEPRPQPEPAQPPERPRATPRAAPTPASEPPPPLSREEVARWLERTGDDPSRALRTLREEGPERRPRSPW